jgi:hypothetical protein
MSIAVITPLQRGMASLRKLVLVSSRSTSRVRRGLQRQLVFIVERPWTAKVTPAIHRCWGSRDKLLYILNDRGLGAMSLTWIVYRGFRVLWDAD